MSPRIGRTFGRFHHRVSLRLAVWKLCRALDGRWVYPLLEEAMEASVLQEVNTYVSHHQNTVTQYITTRPIMYLCLSMDRRPGTRVSKRWWVQ